MYIYMCIIRIYFKNHHRLWDQASLGSNCNFTNFWQCDDGQIKISASLVPLAFKGMI